MRVRIYVGFSFHFVPNMYRSLLWRCITCIKDISSHPWSNLWEPRFLKKNKSATCLPWSIHLSVSWPAFPSPTIVGPDVSFSHSRQGGIRFNTVNMTSGTFPASGQYCPILSLGIVFVDTLPRDSIGQYCFSIPDNSWSRRVNISKQCNLVLTPCHSSTKGWDMDDDLSWHQSQWDSDFWHPS